MQELANNNMHDARTTMTPWGTIAAKITAPVTHNFIIRQDTTNVLEKRAYKYDGIHV
jgi:hypothetical protein